MALPISTGEGVSGRAFRSVPELLLLPMLPASDSHVSPFTEDPNPRRSSAASSECVSGEAEVQPSKQARIRNVTFIVVTLDRSAGEMKN